MPRYGVKGKRESQVHPAVPLLSQSRETTRQSVGQTQSRAGRVHSVCPSCSEIQVRILPGRPLKRMCIMISETELSNVPLEADRTRNIPTHQPTVPHLEDDSYQAWWYQATSGWPVEARAPETTSTVVSEEGRLYVLRPDGAITRALESDLRQFTEPLPAPAIVMPRFKRTSDGRLGAVRD